MDEKPEVKRAGCGALALIFFTCVLLVTFVVIAFLALVGAL